MEVSGVVFQRLHSLSSSFLFIETIFLRLSSVKPKRSISNVRSFGILANSTSGFCDNGHLEYNNGPTTTSSCFANRRNEKEITLKKKKTVKKKLKVLKGLSKNLSTFSDMGFGLDPDYGLADQVKGKMISKERGIGGDLEQDIGFRLMDLRLVVGVCHVRRQRATSLHCRTPAASLMASSAMDDDKEQPPSTISSRLGFGYKALP